MTAPAPSDPAQGPPERARRAAPQQTPVETWHGYRLNPFQVEAVAAIRAGHNVLVGAPTGAGKTLVAEFAIEDAVARGRRVVYTAPIKALSNQKYRDFKAAALDVGLSTGDVTIQPTAQVLVMTTEILRNAIFEDPDYLRDVDYVVFDEIHYLDDAERGTVWEECLIFAPPSVRFICLSATVANMDELGDWIAEIREQDIVTIESMERPVPLRYFLYAPGKGVTPIGKLASLVKRVHGGGQRGRGPRDRRGRRFGERGEGRPGRPEIGPLLDEMIGRGELPALVFCFSRKECERLARASGRRNLLAPEERERMQALIAELAVQFQLPPERLRGELFELARRGVGHHHAGMLPIDKELVERMFTTGLLRLLFATETFALGINMPARAAVFPSLKKFDGVTLDWLRTREFLQMAGRAGRQGLDKEGLVYAVLTERDVEEAPLLRIFSGVPEPVSSRFRLSYSTILHLVERVGRARVLAAWEKSFNQFQHRERAPKAQVKNERRQQRLIDAHLAVLAEFGYIDEDDRLTPRGRIAQRIAGYEIQVTELLFRGLLEDLPPRALAIVFVAQIFEERRPGAGPFLPERTFGDLRRRIDRMQAQIATRELALGLDAPSKQPDWGLTAAVLAWYDGAALEDLGDLTEASPGDLCRTLRMALQLMRQVRRAIDPDWDLHATLARAMAHIDRDEVDARRQLELG